MWHLVRLLLIVRLVLCYTFFTQLLSSYRVGFPQRSQARRNPTARAALLCSALPLEIAHVCVGVWAWHSVHVCVCVCLSPLMSSATWPLLKQAKRTNKLKGSAQDRSQREEEEQEKEELGLALRAHSASLR